MRAILVRLSLTTAMCLAAVGCKDSEPNVYRGARIRIGGDGIIEESVVTDRIMGKIVDVQRCYSARLKKDSSLTGKVVVEFTIETSGSITGVKVAENETGDDAVARCVTKIVKNLRFSPGPTGGTAVFRYPFEFGQKSL